MVWRIFFWLRRAIARRRSSRRWRGQRGFCCHGWRGFRLFSPFALSAVFQDDAPVFGHARTAGFYPMLLQQFRNGGIGHILLAQFHNGIAGENIAYASHIFPSHARSGWDHDFGRVAARYPVVITEWGFIDKKETPNPSDSYLSGNAGTYGDPLMSYLAERGIGWVACWFDEQWQPAMLLPGGNGYTDWGKFATLELKNTR